MEAFIGLAAIVAFAYYATITIENGYQFVTIR